MKLTEKNIIRIIREEYRKRLFQLEIAAKIAEAEVIDKRGNILLAKDLKVRHRKSGYEYTIDSVEGERDSMQITLRKPDVPRIDAPKVMKRMNEDDEQLLTSAEIMELPEEQVKPGDTFVISAEEFEKEYIVD